MLLNSSGEGEPQSCSNFMLTVNHEIDPLVVITFYRAIFHVNRYILANTTKT